MASSLLEDVRIVDLAGEPAAAAGRVLADLGADVVLVERRTVWRCARFPTASVRD